MTASHPRRLAALALAATAAIVVAACGSAATSSAPASVAPTASSAAVASPSADPNAGHEPVTISVGVLRPGATQEAVDALNLQISEFEAKYPWITVDARGVQLDRPDVHRGARRAARCRTCSRSRSPTARA